MSLILQLEMLTVERVSDHEAIITFLPHASVKPVQAIATPILTLLKTFRKSFSIRPGQRLVAEIELSIRHTKLHAQTNKFYFFSCNSESTLNTLVGFGVVCGVPENAAESVFSDKLLVEVECTTYDSLAFPKKSTLLIVLEINRNALEQEYTAGQSLFFTGILLDVTGSTLRGMTTHSPIVTNKSIFTRSGLATPPAPPSFKSSVIMQIEILGARSTSQGTIIQFKTDRSNSPFMNAISSPRTGFETVFQREFKVYPECRLVAEVEFWFRGDRLHVQVNTFYFFSHESDSTRNSLAAWGTICENRDERMQASEFEKRLIYVDCISVNGALQDDGKLRVALEIDDVEAARHYTPGNAIFFSGILLQILGKVFQVTATHLPIFTSSIQTEIRKLTPPHTARSNKLLH